MSGLEFQGLIFAFCRRSFVGVFRPWPLCTGVVHSWMWSSSKGCFILHPKLKSRLDVYFHTHFSSFQAHSAVLQINPFHCNTCHCVGFFLPGSSLRPCIHFLATNLSRIQRHNVWQKDPSCTMSVLSPFRSFWPFTYLYKCVWKSHTDRHTFWPSWTTASQTIVFHLVKVSCWKWSG